MTLATSAVLLAGCHRLLLSTTRTELAPAASMLANELVLGRIPGVRVVDASQHERGAVAFEQGGYR